jgi:HK97 family phage major capsid protein
MKALFPVRAVASGIQTSTGAQMLFPTTDSTSEEGEIIGQNTVVSVGETSFGQASLDVYKYSSKSIALPFELLQDSMFNIEEYIQTLLRLRLGRIQNRHHTVGTGSGQPRGVVTAAGAGKVGATGQTVTVTYDDFVDLEHSIDPYYRAAAKWMMHDDMLKVSRKIKDATSVRSSFLATSKATQAVPQIAAGPRDRSESAHGVPGCQCQVPAVRRF